MDDSPVATIRGYLRSDDEGLLALFTTAFDGWPKVTVNARPIEHLRWKTVSHPRAAAASVVAESGNRIVGASMQWVFLAIVAGEPRLATCGFDTSVLPEFRGRDVYTRLRSEHATFDPWVDLRIGTTVNEFVRRKRESFGYRFFGNPVEELAWPPSRQRRRGPGRFTVATQRIFRTLPRLPSPGVVATPFDAEFEAFAAEASRPFDFLAARTATRLAWRYLDPRGGPSVVRLFRDGGRLAGYSVLRARGRRGYLADILTLPGRDDLVRAVARDASAYLSRRGFALVLAWLPRHHPYRAALESEGFSPSGRVIDLRYQPVATSAGDLAFLDSPDAAFHFTIGDTDLV